MNSSCSCCYFLLIIGNDKAFAAISLARRQSPMLHDFPTRNSSATREYSTKENVFDKAGKLLMALTLFSVL